MQRTVGRVYYKIQYRSSSRNAPRARGRARLGEAVSLGVCAVWAVGVRARARPSLSIHSSVPL